MADSQKLIIARMTGKLPEEPDEQEAIARAAQRFLDDVSELAQAVAESIGAAFSRLADLLNGVAEEAEAKREKETRHNWPRPVNQRARPLFIDKRSRVYRCRNAC